MGLLTTSDNNMSKTYLNILGGKITQKVEKGTEGAIARINKKNVEVWELHHDTLMGRIVDISLEPSDYGNVWVVTIQDGIDYYYLHLSYSGRVTNGLMHRLPNINLEKEVAIKVFRIFDKDKQKDVDFLVVYQGGLGKENKVPPYYTKDTPNGLPQMEQIKVKGVLTWDDSKQMEFIEDMIKTTILPKLHGAPTPAYKKDEPNVSTARDRIVSEAKAHEAEIESDDLPF